MNVLIEKHDAQTAILRPIGELDYRTADRFKETWGVLVDEGFTSFVIDLSRVSVLDSTGLGGILSLGKRVGIDHVQLAQPSPPVHIVITTTNLFRLFRCHPSVETALRRAAFPSAEDA